MKKAYIVISPPYCESEETCECHWSAYDIEAVFLDEQKANDYAKQNNRYSVKEYEIKE